MSSEFTLKEQISKFIEFEHYYNFTRPHEAIGQQTPGSVYIPSNRSWNGCLKSPEYGSDYKVHRVRSCGKISFKGVNIYIGRALVGEPIGLVDTSNGYMAFFGNIGLGTIRDGKLEFDKRKPRKSRKKVQGI